MRDTMRTGKPKGKTASGRSMNRTSLMPSNSNYLFTSLSTSQKQPIESTIAAAAAIYSTSIANFNLPEPKPYRQPRARAGPPYLLASMRKNPPQELRDRTKPHRLPPLHHTNADDQTPNTQVSMPGQSQNFNTTTAAMSAALSATKQSTSIPDLRAGSSTKDQTFEQKTVNNLPKSALKNNKTQAVREASIDNSTSSPQDATSKRLKTQSLRERHPTFASLPEIHTIDEESLDEHPIVEEAQAMPILKRSKTQIFRDQFKALKDDHKQGTGDIDIVVSGVRGWIRRIKIKRAENMQLKNMSTTEPFPEFDPKFDGKSKPKAKISSVSEINLLGTTTKTLGDRLASIAKRFKSHKNETKQQPRVAVAKAMISQPFDFIEGEVAHERWSRDRPGANERVLFNKETASRGRDSSQWKDLSVESTSFKEKESSGESASLKKENTSGLGIYLDSQAATAHNDLPLHPTLAKPKPTRQADTDGESDSESVFTDSAFTNWSAVIAHADSSPGHDTLQECMPTEDETAKLDNASTKLKPIPTEGNVGRTGTFDFPYSSNPLRKRRRPINQNLTFWSQTGKAIKKAKVFKTRVEGFERLSECASLRDHTCSPSKSCFECLQASAELETLIASNCQAAQETSSFSKADSTANATVPEIAPRAEYSSSSHPLTASALASHNAINRARNPFEFEPSDDDAASPAASPAFASAHTSPSTSRASTPTPLPRRHAFHVAAAPSAAPPRPAPPTRGHRRSAAISVRATNTHAFLTQAAAAAAAAAARGPPSPSVYSSVHRRSGTVSAPARRAPRPPHGARIPRALPGLRDDGEMDELLRVAERRGVLGEGDGPVERRAVAGGVEMRSRGGMGGGRGRGGRGRAVGESSLEGMVRAELRSEDGREEQDGAERNTIFYEFYDDIFDEERPPVPRVDERWL